MTKHMDDTPKSETYVSVSWGMLGEAGKLHLGREKSWKLNKGGGQRKCGASIDDCWGQVCFKFHVAVANASLSCCNPDFPFCRGTEVIPGSPELREPTLLHQVNLRCSLLWPPSCWGELLFAPAAFCQWFNPCDMAVGGSWRYCWYCVMEGP